MGRKKGERQAGSSVPRQTMESLSSDQMYSLAEQHRKNFVVRLAAKRAADKALKDLGKIIKADLGAGGMDMVKALIEGGSPEGEAAIRARIERDAQVLRWLGVPIGTQTDMFPTDDRTPLSERAFNEGKRVGLAGESRDNPHHPNTEAHRFYEDGYNEGQKTLATRGFSKLEPKQEDGDDPNRKWIDKTGRENDAVDHAIKTGTVHKLGSKEPTHTVTA